VSANGPGVTLTAYESHDAGSQAYGTIALCTRDHLNAATATSLWTTDYRFVPQGKYVNRVVVQGSILTLQRNECLKRMEGDWILFIDDDMVWQPLDIGRLVASWQEVQGQMDVPVIMGGLCFRRTPPHDPTLFVREQPTSGGYRHLETWTDSIVEVDATGMAFVLIPLAALEKMCGFAWPSLETRKAVDPPPMFKWEGGVGEDLRFCQEAKDSGCRIFVDTTIEIGHIAEVSITRKHFLAEIAARSPEQQVKVARANNRMGIDTMTPQQAREKLGWI